MSFGLKNKRWISLLLFVVSLLLIVYGVVLLTRSNSSAAKPPAQALAAAPKPNKPTQKEIDDYKVAADTPRYIYIPAINVPQTRVMHLGVDKNGQIAVPDNINDAGWYVDSAKPGKSGAMFIYGHISSWQAKGLFYDLHKLKSGDKVTVESGDGHKYNYEVVKTKIYQADKINMGEVLAPVESGQPGLNLMTCAGKIKPGTSEFTERLVVFTRQV